MKKTLLTFILVFAVIVCLFSGCGRYNSLVKERENVDEVWANVEVQYQRRLDLIPNLVETVKGYAKHESETYEKVTEARAGLSAAYENAKASKDTPDVAEDQQKFNKFNSSQAELNKALSIYVNAVHEAYPDLKADKQFTDLQTQLEGTENRIATARKDYTAAVKEYNIMCSTFPGNLIANLFGFHKRPQFQAEEAAATAPKVSF